MDRPSKRMIGKMMWAAVQPTFDIKCLLLLALLAALLSGCATIKDPETFQEYSGDIVAHIQPGQVVGQSFVSRRGGLVEVQLWLRTIPGKFGSNPSLTVELYHAPDDTTPLATVAFPFQRVGDPPFTVAFPVQSDAPQQAYFVALKTMDGEVEVLGRAEDVYPYGALYIDGQAQDADATLRTAYRYGWGSLVEDALHTAGGGWIIIPLLVVMWAPGRLLVWPLLRHGEWDWGPRTGLSMGASLAPAPLVVLWTTTTGLAWSRAAVIWAYALAAALLVAAIMVQTYRDHFRFRRRSPGADWQRPQIDLHSLALASVLVFTLAVRLVMVRDLAGPPWVDPIHHSLITRLIMQQGGLPSNFESAAETEGQRYHPGFHVTTAAFSQLSGLPIPETMLLFGQVLNAASVLAVYLLAVTLTRNRTTGLFAALITGVCFPMPAYYVSWGRYTHLAGLVILPAAVALIEAPSRTNDASKKWTLLLAAITCAGLFLTHYRVTAFLALWLAAHLLAETLRRLDQQPVWRSLAMLGGRYLVVGVIAILLPLPWSPGLWQEMVAPRLGRSGAAIALEISWNYLTPVFGRQVMWLAALGLLVSILRLGWFGPTLALWIGLMFMSAQQGSVRLPLGGSIDKLSVEISLFAPFSVLAGYLLSSLLSWVKRYAGKIVWVAASGATALAVVALAAAATPKMINLLNPNTILLRQADLPAIAWIETNLPKEATLAINPFLWGYGAYAGQDGGYWISPLTGRQTLPPIVTYNLGERELVDRVNRASQAVLNDSGEAQKLYETLKANEIDYVYLGRRGGSLSPRALRESSLFVARYHQDGVWIFQLRGD